jgi:hypothetical protein
LPEFLRAAIEAGTSTPGVLVVNDQDYAENNEAYDSLVLPIGWSVYVVPGDDVTSKTEQARRELLTPDMAWVGWLADDLRPVTPNWDTRLISQLTGYNIVSSDDDLHAPERMNGGIVLSADLVRAVGWLSLPTLIHMHGDSAWEELGRATGTWTVDMSVLVRHLHERKTGQKDETSRKTNESWEHDDRAINVWRKNEKAATIERILTLMQESGVEMFRPDLHGVEVMLATPCGDGRYENLFVESLRQTEMYVRQYGGEFRFAEMLMVSDISIARARIIGAFLHSTATHLFMIDDDQAWNPMDFVKFLLAGRDFMAAASVRKVTPSSFAVNITDDYGRPLPIHVDERGYIEASNVGAAFVCLTRACVERMVEAYRGELAFDAAEGREEYALFNPMILNRRYLGEDYSFCQRWRTIGGKVWVDPTVDLRHVGVSVWSGTWLNHLAEQMAAERAA